MAGRSSRTQPDISVTKPRLLFSPFWETRPEERSFFLLFGPLLRVGFSASCAVSTGLAWAVFAGDFCRLVGMGPCLRERFLGNRKKRRGGRYATG